MNYLYKCFNCNKEWSANQIEKDFTYICSYCGKAEKNKPIEGVLTVEYDYDQFKNKSSREEFLRLNPGKFWLYPDLWPLNFDNSSEDQLDKLALPSDQFLKFEINNKTVSN